MLVVGHYLERGAVRDGGRLGFGGKKRMMGG